MIAAGRWTLRQRVSTLVVLVALALTALAAAAAAVAANNRGHLDTLLTETDPLRTDAQALMSALVNQETGIRGYALSGDRLDLEPYEKGLAQERLLVDRIGRLVADQAGIRRELDVVREQARQWRANVAEPVIRAAATSTADAQALLTDEARHRFDGLRDAVTALQESISVLRDRVAADARQSGNTLVLLLVLAAVVVVFAGVALLMSLNRLVIAPVTGLAAQVREVATGDYQRDIEATGPPELAQLGRDVDAMRRRIAADLAEVREARGRIEWVNSQLQKQAEELVRSNRDLEQFAYVASHDLQEPLRKVASFCQLLQRRYAGQLDERADQYIAFAVDGAQRMQRLINDLLAFSRIGRLTAGFTDVDLDAVMSEVVGQTEAARRYAGGELTWSDLPVVRGEEALLTTLLVNLVSNSLKFRRPEVPARVHVSARRDGDEWEITCQDNGIGIEPEFADKVFVIFQRLHSRDAYPGTGIGLAIAKKIVEYHGGRVWVDSNVDVGTAVRFTIPVTEPAPTVPIEPTSVPAEPTEPSVPAEPTEPAARVGVAELAGPAMTGATGPVVPAEPPGRAVPAQAEPAAGQSAGERNDHAADGVAQETGGTKETLA